MKKKRIFIILTIILILFAFTSNVSAEPLEIEVPGLDIGFNQDGEPEEVVSSLKLLILFTFLTLAPSFIILMTSFTRIIVVLSLLRNAVGTQQTPPNQILIALALFMTLFIMSPVYGEVIDDAINPYLDGTISQEEAIEVGSEPIKEFMLKQTREKDLALFINMSKMDLPNERLDTPFRVLVPAFVISELKTAFQIGFLLFIPFIVIDLIVASILMSMGMFMLPPVMISLPFKLLLFVMVDGWFIVIKSLIESFH
ncbi:MAG: flagellar type III secretion system pore protein FliP [Firmicutes bacterium]|nr:flagellar type III secretion system pore protein FliP [Bacillota bacterium]